MNLMCPVGLLLLITFHAADETPAKSRDCPVQDTATKTPKEEEPKPVLTFDRSQVKPADPAKGQPLARVLDQYIYPADMQADSAELTREQSDAFSGRILTALFQKFSDERRLCATDEEVAQFQKAIDFDSVSVTEELQQLTEEEQREFEAEMQKMAEISVVGWKRDRALYERYGGIVIFQQGNPFEPVGAYRQFLEETEKLGAFEIYDVKRREQFWHYFVMKHPFQVPAGDIDFSQPWWAKIDPKTTPTDP